MQCRVAFDGTEFPHFTKDQFVTMVMWLFCKTVLLANFLTIRYGYAPSRNL